MVSIAIGAVKNFCGAIKMNKRKSKKKESKDLFVGGSYRDTRIYNRRSHEFSIAVSRHEHFNYWCTWDRGYPNRTRIRRILRYERKKYAE